MSELRRTIIKPIIWLKMFFFTYQVIFKGSIVQIISDITYYLFYHENDSSIMTETRKLFTIAMAKQYEEIIS
jgi:hypothetical protein